jgi:DNA-binding MarR family transcriptional regulator
MNDSRNDGIYGVIWQTRRLFQRLRAASDDLLAGTGINASQRALLEFLHRQQPQTVPQIARQKSVSRQHIQSVANELLALGLIAAENNPGHKRSRLLRLTGKGRALFEAVRRKEAGVLERMQEDFDTNQLATTIDTLESIDAWLASKDWKKDMKP